MKQIFRNWLLVSPFILGITVVASAAAIAVEVPEATVAAQSQHESVQPKSPIAHQTGATHLAQTSNHEQEATSSSPVLQQDTTSVTTYERRILWDKLLLFPSFLMFNRLTGLFKHYSR